MGKEQHSTMKHMQCGSQLEQYIIIIKLEQFKICFVYSVLLMSGLDLLEGDRDGHLASVRKARDYYRSCMNESK